MNIIEDIKSDIIKLSNEYKNNSLDKFDFWNEHIKYVYEEAIMLAEKYNADLEIVKLGALLHDISLIKEVGDKKDHHINGKILSLEMLKKYDYPKEKMDRVLGCVYNHRSSKNANNIEEICVCDADILAHFDNIPMLFNSIISKNKITLNELRDSLRNSFEKDYDDLSEKTKESFKERYKLILDIILNQRDNYDNK